MSSPTSNLASPDPSPDPSPELLTVAQACILLGVGRRTLDRWSRSGISPAPLKIGKGLRAAIRYRRTDLMQWIADGCEPCQFKPFKR